MTVLYHCVACQITRRWRLVDGEVTPAELQKAVWMIHMDETDLGQRCAAVEVVTPIVFGSRCFDPRIPNSELSEAWYIFLPRMLSPDQYRRGVSEGCAEIEYLLDGEFVVFRYLSGIQKSEVRSQKERI